MYTRFTLFSLLLFPSLLSGQDIYETFDGLALDPAWSWVREDRSHWQLTGGVMQITTQPGALNGTTHNDVRNLLLRDAPASPTFILETFVEFEPDSMYHNAGLIYYIDDDNYIRVSRGIDENIDGLWMEWELNGITSFFRISGVTSSATYLRLSRTNGTYFFASYSLNGFEWYRIGDETILFPTNGAQVGIQAANGVGILATPNRIPARFDYFGGRIVTSADDLPRVASFSVRPLFPNPLSSHASASLIVSSDHPVELHVRVIDHSGRVLFRRRFAHERTGEATFQLPADRFPSGTFLIEVRSSDKSVFIPLVIAR